MKKHRSGCRLCGRDLEYFKTPRPLKCLGCGESFDSEVSCEDGHFVCDSCHARSGYIVIDDIAKKNASADPVSIATEMMKHDAINMHGPEHHHLVIAALLAAYKNSGGDIDLDKALSVAGQRSKNVPGGICGQWGCCGAAVGSGIFISIITGATPLSIKEWSQANKMTSLSLELISQNGGPRCCKRNTYLAILTAMEFLKEEFGFTLDQSNSPNCVFCQNNPTCKGNGCLFRSCDNLSASLT